MTSIVEQIISKIPGAGTSSTSSGKNKRSKKKAPAAGGGASSAATPEDSAGPAPAETAQAPSGSTATASAEEATPAAPAAEPKVDAVGTSSREKGPVEEVIAKRMRQLNKKLQRYRTYASAPQDTLNADQRAALASLPLLEGIYKELEDLSKQVEYVELEQAGKVREIREQARREGEASGSDKLTAFQGCLAAPLSLFLRLYALLHPARSSDHEHLTTPTFVRLALPPQLEDEVQATDVLRVGRMYEDLTTGGEAGKKVVEGLVKGATGEDDENDHVHHLMNLLSQSPDSAASQNEQTEQVDQIEAGTEAAEDIPDDVEVEQLESKVPSEGGLPNGHQETDATIAARSDATVPGRSTGGVFNFLQEDELEEGSDGIQPTAQSQTPESHSLATSVPVLEPAVSTTASAAAPSAPVSDMFNPDPNAPTPKFDWAADEDEEETTHTQSLRDSSTANADPAGQIDEETVEAIGEERPAIALVQENEPVSSTDAIDAPTASPAQATPTPPAGAASTSSTPSQKAPRQRQYSQKQSQPKPQRPSTILDEDGFQVVGRTPSFSSAGRGRGSNRGRGEFGRGGAGGRGGQGGGRGRNASGLGRGGQNAPNTSSGEDGHKRQPNQGRQLRRGGSAPHGEGRQAAQAHAHAGQQRQALPRAPAAPTAA